MSHAEIEMQDRDLEAQDSGAAAVGRTFGSEIAWLILRHFVAELPGLSSVKHPFEKCQEVSEKAESLKLAAEGLRALCEDMVSALREGNEDEGSEQQQAMEALVKELTSLSRKGEDITNMTQVDRAIRYDKLKKSFDEMSVTLKVLERRYHDYKLDCVRVYLRNEVKRELGNVKEELKDELRRTLLSMSLASSTASKA